MMSGIEKYNKDIIRPNPKFCIQLGTVLMSVRNCVSIKSFKES